jgi:ribonuclease HI
VKSVKIYTDGACSGNPGKGGWGAVIIHGQTEIPISGYDEYTTNNKMELTAVIEALSSLQEPCEVELYSDSAYIINAIEKRWLENWKSNDWKTSDRKDVKNKEHWLEIDRLNNAHKIKWIKVKGHSNNKYNDICDRLATDEIKNNTRGVGL